MKDFNEDNIILVTFYGKLKRIVISDESVHIWLYLLGPICETYSLR